MATFVKQMTMGDNTKGGLVVTPTIGSDVMFEFQLSK